MTGSAGRTDPESRRRPQREMLWLMGILFLAAALRFWGLGAKSLWLDEAMTVHKATQSFGGMMKEILQTDAHPPLFQIVEWLWLRLDHGDAFARVPAAAAGVVCVWLSFLIARRLFGRKAAIAAGLMMALSYFGVFYSQEARLQSLMTALFLGQVCVLLRILERRGKAGWGIWCAYGLLGLASLYTYALCALTVGALALLYLLLTWRRNRQIRQWLAVHAAIALLFLPWVPTLRARTADLEASIQAYHDEVGRPSFSEIGSAFVAWAIGPTSRPELKRSALLGFGCVLVAALAAFRCKARRPAIILAVLFFVPLIAYLVLPMPRVHHYDAKHLMFIQPILLIALSGARLPFRFRSTDLRAPILAAVVLAFAALNAFGLRDYFRPDFEKENWRRLASEVTARIGEGDLLLYNPGYAGYAFDYYAQPKVAEAGAEPLLQPGRRIEGNFQRIWLIEDESAVARPFPQVRTKLEEAGWRYRTTKVYKGSLGEVRWTPWFPKDAP